VAICQIYVAFKFLFLRRPLIFWVFLADPTRLLALGYQAQARGAGAEEQGAPSFFLKEEEEPVGCFQVGLRFFGLFYKNLLRLILTPPARYQHLHDTNNPPVGRWGNCEPKRGFKAAPSPPQKQNSEHTRQKEVNSTGW
jgi:hypothetical protein